MRPVSTLSCRPAASAAGSDAITTVADHSHVTTAEFGAHTQLATNADVADAAASTTRSEAVRTLRHSQAGGRNCNMFDVADEELPVVATIASLFADEGTARRKVAAMEGFSQQLVDAMGERKGGFRSSAFIPLGNRFHGARRQCRQHESRGCVSSAPETAAATSRSEVPRLPRRVRQDQIMEGMDSHGRKPTSANLPRTLYEYTHTQASRSRFKPPPIAGALEHSSWRCPKPRTTANSTPSSRRRTPRHFRHRWRSFKRTDELSACMFAGEGEPERTNRRFHYLSQAKTTLALHRLRPAHPHGRDPPPRHLKAGNSGFPSPRPTTPSASTRLRLVHRHHFGLDDHQQAGAHHSGLLPNALDQQVEAYLAEQGKPAAPLDSAYRGELPKGTTGLVFRGTTGRREVDADTYAEIKARTLQTVRGTVQAIFSED